MRVCLWLLCLFPGLLAAEPLTLESRPGQVAVVELYTSQGCSSCPPADAWLSSWANDPRLWQHIIPLAFHVDYWDYLGWRDPFADAANSRRQRRYRQSGHIKSVYTPGFVVNGREWRDWWGSKTLPAERLNGATLRGQWDGEQLSVSYADPAAGQQLHVALLGFGLQTAVARGENRDRRLSEDFVVLRHSRHASDDGHWQLRWADEPSRSERQALVLWVSAGDDPAPLQAAAGWLP